VPPLHSLFLLLSAIIIFALGALHLLLTFRGSQFHPRDRELELRMKAIPPLISTDTTMWKAAIGFHASHSIGAMLFSVVYGYLALEPTQLLFHSPFLLGAGLVYLALLVLLCRLYWLRLPFTAMLIASSLYAAAIITNAA
jgi:hypothetical protein